MDNNEKEYSNYRDLHCEFLNIFKFVWKSCGMEREERDNNEDLGSDDSTVFLSNMIDIQGTTK